MLLLLKNLMLVLLTIVHLSLADPSADRVVVEVLARSRVPEMRKGLLEICLFVWMALVIT